jgi:isoquinoline 1-oxidoreductase beta subunit
MGQGTWTTLPAVVADELDADWSKVRIVPPPAWVEESWGNPGFGGALLTVASHSVRGYFQSLRIAGAQARRVLLDTMAARWNVPVGFAQVPATLPEIAETDLKPATAFRYIGKDLDRREIPSKVVGAARYAMDVQVPDMVYAAVLQPPYPGGTPQSVNEAEILELPGISHVVRLPDGVGVVGTSVEATREARNRLEVEWSTAPGADYDSEQALEEFAAAARETTLAGVPFEAVGDAREAIAKADRVFRAEYRTRYLYHAQMEPLSATASVSSDGKSAEVWAGTQSPTLLLGVVAHVLDTPRSNLTFHQHFLGGGFGRRASQEVIVMAVRLSREVGKPVKLIWSREDDLGFGKYRPMTAHHIEAGLDATGKLIGWHHRIASESVVEFMAADLGYPPEPVDDIVMKGSSIPQYAIPNKLPEHVVQPLRARVSAWRGVGNAHNAFAAECFLDEIAGQLSKDPLAFRLELAEGQPRMQHLLREVRDMSDWDRPRDGTGLGVATMVKDDTLVASVAEVSVDRASGRVKVLNFWCAVDAGIAVQPRNLEAITSSSVVYGLGHVLREQITIKDGRVQQTNFPDYEVMRMSDVPNIEVRVVSTDNPPTGGGEGAVPVLACAVGNAIATLTGVRLRELPFSPERVRNALGT